jgi:hypothetical protein
LVSLLGHLEDAQGVVNFGMGSPVDFYGLSQLTELGGWRGVGL